FIRDDDGLLRAGVGGLADLLRLVGRHHLVDRRRTAVDVAEPERIRSDHRAEGVALAAFWINPDLHGVSLRGSEVAQLRWSYHLRSPPASTRNCGPVRAPRR